MIKHIYGILLLVVCFNGFVSGQTKISKNEKDLLEKSLVILNQITDTGSVESKAETPALWALIRSDASRTKLEQLLNEKNHTVMAEAARALYSVNDTAGKQYLEQVLLEKISIDEKSTPIERFKRFSGYKFRKIAAAEALGAIGDEKSFRLIQTLKTETQDGQIRDACSIALAMLGDPAERIIFESALNLKTSDPDIRKAAAQALGKIKNNASIGVLAKSLLDPDPSVRAESAAALGLIGNAQSAVQLRDRVYDDDINVKREVMRALGRIHDEENLPVMTEALEHDDGVLRLIAAGAIGYYGSLEGIPIIGIAIKDNDRDVRLQAVESLDLLDKRDSMTMLGTLLEDKDDTVRIKAAGVILKRMLE